MKVPLFSAVCCLVCLSPLFADSPGLPTSHHHRGVDQVIVYERAARNRVFAEGGSARRRRQSLSRLRSSHHRAGSHAYAIRSRHSNVDPSTQAARAEHSGQVVRFGSLRPYRNSGTPFLDRHHRLAEIDRMRDRAVATGDLRLLQLSNRLERQLRQPPPTAAASATFSQPRIRDRDAAVPVRQ